MSGEAAYWKLKFEESEARRQGLLRELLDVQRQLDAMDRWLKGREAEVSENGKEG